MKDLLVPEEETIIENIKRICTSVGIYDSFEVLSPSVYQLFLYKSTYDGYIKNITILVSELGATITANYFRNTVSSFLLKDEFQFIQNEEGSGNRLEELLLWFIE